MMNHTLVTILKHRLSIRSDHSWFSLVPLVYAWSAGAISRIMFAPIQVVRSFSWLIAPITITIPRRIKLRSSHSFFLHFPWNLRRQQFARTCFTFLWYFHRLLRISPSSTVTLCWATGLRRLFDVRYLWWYIETGLRHRLLLITLLNSIGLKRTRLSSIRLIIGRYVGSMMVITWRLAIVKIKISLWIIAATTTANYLRWVPRSIDYSRMCVFNLPW